MTASYTCGCDSAWSVVNGIYSYTDSPRDRWTNYGSPNSVDWIAVDFGSVQSFNQIKLYIFDDGGGVKPPSGYQIRYWNGEGWADVSNQTKTPSNPAAFLNTVDFDTVASQKIQIAFTNRNDAYSGLVELEVFKQPSSADSSAAAAVMTLIEQLPAPSAVTLSDQSAIAAAQTAYQNLTVTQKSLVANLSKLSAAEAALGALQPSYTDVVVQSAFGNAVGNAITLRLSSVVDATYVMQATYFQLAVNGTQASVTSAVYDWSDSGRQTIKLSFPSPVLLNETSAALSIQSGAFKTGSGTFNNTILPIPVITFKKLDLTLDHRIGVDDAVRIIVNPAMHIDVNRDGVFDRTDIKSILERISPF